MATVVTARQREAHQRVWNCLRKGKKPKAEERPAGACPHHWDVAAESVDGYFPAECRLCGDKRKFPVPEW